ncbi:MAG: tripartite tricarboxylate transporter permease [Spirochaetales bacterium]|jgi:putative tricarboxylic transport membrane protein|nr:tripartite tricarboxylate transporter permease [Spirochaetales bacterium]
MENILMLFSGFSTVFAFNNLAACLFGALMGLIVGAMPGIGSLAGCALLLPLTYKFNPTTAIIMLGAVYYANMYGGAFSAILLNIPGDSPAVMTAVDGYPMATTRGRPGQALFVSNISSCIGGFIGILILTFTGPALAEIGLAFGPAEMTSLLLMAMTSVGWLMGESPIKGVIATLLGIILANIGMDTLSGSPRFNFGSLYLMGGIPFIPFVIGSVGFAQIIKIMENRNADPQKLNQKLTIRSSLLSIKEFRRLLPPAIRSGFLGTFVGVLPGAGATTAAFLGYAAQRPFKSEEPLGTGAVEGIAACEAANNAAAAGAFAPLLALGIPGSGTGAVLLGGLIMWGLTPGPLLFTKSPDFAWGLIASLYLANLCALFIAAGIIPFLVKILSVPIKLMIPLITVVCFVGAYSSSNSMYGVLVMLLSGVLGYILDKHKYPLAPMLLAFVLAPMLESNMRKAFIISQGSLSIFVTRPISLVFLAIMAALILFPVIKTAIKRIRKESPK